MKKIVIVLIIALSVTFVNAQNTKPTTPAAQTSKTAIKVAELQKPITDNITKDYVGYKTTEAYKVDKGEIAYEVVVEKDAKKVYLFYDKTGKFIRKKNQVEAKIAPATPNKTTTPKKK